MLSAPNMAHERQRQLREERQEQGKDFTSLFLAFSILENKRVCISNPHFCLKIIIIINNKYLIRHKIIVLSAIYKKQ